MIWRVISTSKLGDEPMVDVTELQRSMLSDFRAETYTYPTLNVWSNPNEAVVAAEVPGSDPKALNLTVAGDLLTIEGERKPEEAGGNDVYYLKERSSGKFSRTVRLPYEVEKDAVKASCTHGVLRITLPKAKKLESKQIPVEAGE